MDQVKQHRMIPTPNVRSWFQDVAKRTGLFAVKERSEERQEEFTRWDDVVTLRPQSGAEPLRLLVEFKPRLYPQDALVVAHRLRGEALPPYPPTIAAVAAPYISERVAEICREHHLAYIDAVGNCHLVAPGLYLHVEGRRNERPDTRAAENLFAPKSSRVVRVLIEEPTRVWRVQDLARAASVSMGLASRLKHKLIEQAFVEESGDGLRVRRPQQLLEAWTSAYANTALALPVYSMEQTRTFERRVAVWCAHHGVAYALAEFSAAARWSPMVRYKRAAVYIHESRSPDVVSRLMRELDLKEVESGSTAVLWATDDEAVFFHSEEHDGVRVVSPVQAYLDLTRNPARGQEAAEELLRRYIRPRFAEHGSAGA